MFVLGSPLTSPDRRECPGVPGVEGIIDLVRERLRTTCDLDALLAGTSQDRYHRALEILRAYEEDPTRLIRRAVLTDRVLADQDDLIKLTIQGERSALSKLEGDIGNWYLTPGLEALGKIIAGRPDTFGKVVLTSNFDPLIEISVRRSGGAATSIGIDTDASPDIVAPGPACSVIHFHGLWSGAGTLHRPDQLKTLRPKLLDAICGYLRQYTCVILAYGGWDDMFMCAVESVLTSRQGSPSVLWGYFGRDRESLTSQQQTHHDVFDRIGAFREGFIPYYGIDVHTFLPSLLKRLGHPRRYAAEIRLPSADEHLVLAGAERLPGYLPGDLSHTTPYDPDTLWGTDRGRFIGFINAEAETSTFELLLKTEGRLQRQKDTNPGASKLPVRWWLRLDALRLMASLPDSDVFEHAIVDPCDPRYRYISATGIPGAVKLGFFLDIPEFSSREDAVRVITKCIQRLHNVLNGSTLFGVVAQSFGIPQPDFVDLVDDLKQEWPTVAVDGLNITTAFVDQPLGVATNERFTFQRREAKAVELYSRGHLSEEQFIRSNGLCAFALALRRQLEFPHAVDLCSNFDLSFTDFWWLASRLEPTSARLSRILSLPPSRRAVWGLCSAEEWRNLEVHVQGQVLDARQSRPLAIE